ncbi:hypothetical protein O181_028684 [Austropuccinia psidii MF-1]|uniref:Reverse transcriptase RNase H-like domain-containing protein n=1 Tax=Austropuccinia psidii MF-1 TaxID=1389203 RepID=A0A9Q3CPF5_9BASI|nr:hypothetical protein [Austropuccinia psidii MF-1]
MTWERMKDYEKIRKALTEEALLLTPDWNTPFKLYIYACGYRLGKAFHQVQIIDEKPTEGKIENLHYYLDESVFEVITDCNFMKSLLNLKTPNRHMLRWQIAIQEYRGYMTIVHKSGNNNENADGISRWALANTTDKPGCLPLEEEQKILIEGINITDIGTEFFVEFREYYE